ncbi:holo-ACP synthase [Streptomyces sp. NPDC053048]|uniref:holo-ACP synthase n=1 Tax=Streptomyces sp. NPDC053048 TaxID=3365694 RepID=UPI0037D987D1
MRIGIDVLGLGELDRLLTRPWFRRYVYAEDELALADSFGPDRAREFLAGRFAAKEAVLKALGTGCGGSSGLTPRQIRVVRDAASAPLVRLEGAAAWRAAGIGVSKVAVSIAHKGELVIAVALGHEGDGPAASGTEVTADAEDADADRVAQTVLAELTAIRVGTGKARNRDD